MKLRDYQEEGVQAILKSLREHRRTLAVLATGLGKTVMFCELIKRLPGTGRTMILAHREELIWQACEKVKSIVGGSCEVEMAGLQADQPGQITFAGGHSDVVVSSVQTQNAGRKQRRMERFDPHDFKLLVVDECHHSRSGTYERCIKHYTSNAKCRVLGVTATPKRHDKLALGKVYEDVAYRMDIIEGIFSGWLVPVCQRTVAVQGLDFSRIKTTEGDLNAKELAEVMEYERNLYPIANTTYELSDNGTKRTLVFAASVAHAKRLTEILNRHRNACAQCVTGKTPKLERRAILKDYNENKFPILCNVGVATEGFDSPAIDTVVMARPTKSLGLYTQMAGRGTRTLPGLVDDLDSPELRIKAIAASDKPRLNLVDFAGNSGRHRLITPVDMLGGQYPAKLLDIIKKRAENKAKAANGRTVEIDPVEALKQASEQAEEAKKSKDKRLAEQHRRRHLVVKSQYTTAVVDPFNVYDIRAPIASPLQRTAPLTDNQRRLLTNFGVPTGKLTRSSGGVLINKVMKRRRENMCTFKQANVLKRHGYSIETTFSEAGRIIDELAANNWRRPDEAM